MTPEEHKEAFIQGIADQMRVQPVTFEFKVVKKPKGIKIIQEVTQAEMDSIVKMATKNATPILK